MKNKSGVRGWGLGVPSLAILLSLLVMVAGGMANNGCSKPSGQTQLAEKKTIYTCVMHHQIRRDKPGDCPICGMKLVPLEQVEGTPETAPEGRVQTAPGQGSQEISHAPQLETQGLAPVHLSPYKEQLIGVKYATVQMAPITRAIRTTGRFAGGAGDFASMATDFAAHKSLRSTGRYVVAEVYALDLPLVQVGQKAFVTALSGSGPRLEGRVSLIYPYDETQSRVTRVKITLSQAPPPEIFANVEIEAVTPPRLALPPTAVMDTGTQRYVFTAAGEGFFVPRRITTGYEGDNLWEVISGLKEGEKVVDGALYMIDADSKIQAAFSDVQK